MGEVTNEPSMEEILSSIKRIIADDGEASSSAARMRAMTRRRRPEPEVDEASDEVLELTDAVAEEQEAAPMPEAAKDSEIVSEDVLAASRQRIQSLSAMVVKPEAGPETLEGLVREMLRPMLKDWLDANLPELVERVVAREIARISGKSL